MRTRGQTLVEFALVLPVFMALLLGFAELAFLFASRQAYQNGVDVLADWAAEEMTSPGESWQAGWNAVVREEAQRTKCFDISSAVIFPDTTHEPGDRILVRWACRYSPHVAPGWGSLNITVESEAVVPGAKAPTPSPS